MRDPTSSEAEFDALSLNGTSRAGAASDVAGRSSGQAHLDRGEGAEQPPDRGANRPWRKAVAFSFGLALSIGTYAFVAPRFPAWRPWLMTHLMHLARSSSTVDTAGATASAPIAPGDIQVGPSPTAADSDDAAPADRAAGAHKASRSRRHRSKHQAASKH
jgi:hypothetical protein